MTMKRLLIFAFAIILLVVNSFTSYAVCLSATLQDKQSESQLWKRYKVEKEAFSIALPNPPQHTVSKTSLERLKKERWERRLESAVGPAAFIVYVYENPKPRQRLEEFIGEHNKNNELDLTTERNLTVDGFAGKQYVSQNEDATSQFFASEGHLYRFTASGAPADDPRVRHFFTSIAFGKKPDGIEISEVPGTLFYAETITDVYKGPDVDQKVRITAKPEAEYTSEGIRKDISGAVILRAVFTGTGRIVNIRVVSGLPYGLTEAAVEASRKIKFEPAQKDGKPVSMWLQLVYRFDNFRYVR
jgi:TonB family protein